MSASSKRWNPMAGEWVIIAETTADRPWDGNSVPQEQQVLPEHDPDCYLCPGVVRASGVTNPVYQSTYVFDNDFPSFSMEIPGEATDNHEGAVPAYGICRVVCFSPQHNLTLAEMDTDGFIQVLNTFREQFLDLSSRPNIENVLIFENKGAVIGVSNPHPHGQVYATDFVPRVLEREYRMFQQHLEENGSCLLCDIIGKELTDDRRIICRNPDFIAYVPYFARYSYEVHITPLRHVSSLAYLDKAELASLADIYRQVTVRYDNLFEISSPNITVFHNAPCAEGWEPDPFHFHIEFYPPLRSANKLKYMAGFETGGGNIINPTLPEAAAEALKALSPVHYKKR